MDPQENTIVQVSGPGILFHSLTRWSIVLGIVLKWNRYAHLASGLSCGLAGLAAGMCIGIVGDTGVRANAQQPKLYVGMILILIFAEALALYGFIVGIILTVKASSGCAASMAGQ